MMKSLMAVVAVMSGIGFAADAATIANGSFEGLSGTPFATVAGGDSTTITGWSVGGDSVDWIDTYWDAADGDNSIDLNGEDQGAISQEITDLVAGESYVISFFLSGNSAGGPVVKTVGVDVGEDQSVYTFDTTGSGVPSPMNWAEYAFTFTASNTSQVLTFASLDGGAYGTALDKVSIAPAAVPVPAAGLMLLGGLGAFGALRRRQKA